MTTLAGASEAGLVEHQEGRAEAGTTDLSDTTDLSFKLSSRWTSPQSPNESAKAAGDPPDPTPTPWDPPPSFPFRPAQSVSPSVRYSDAE